VHPFGGDRASRSDPVRTSDVVLADGSRSVAHDALHDDVEFPEVTSGAAPYAVPELDLLGDRTTQ
ncbi:uncharacterized protein METZ01_LOCUS265895, partial [marine metagenome]